MKRNGMRKNLLRTIQRSLGRYIAIAMIIALGCTIFVGLRITKTDMVATGQKYMDAQNMFDLRLLSTYGWTQAQVEAVAQMDGVEQAEGVIWLDVYASLDSDEDDAVYRLYAIPEEISQVYLLGGRMPESADECLVDGENATDDILGTQVQITAENDDDTLDSLNCRTFTVVGYVSTPLYMDLTRGSSSLGNGSFSSYIYIPAEAFSQDYYTEIQLTITGDWEIYSDAYSDAMDAMASQLETAIEPLAFERLEQVRSEAEQAYAEGLQEYQDGLAEYEQASEEAAQTLADALQTLEDAQAEIDENRRTLEDGRTQLAEAQAQIEQSKAALDESTLTLANQKAETYAQIADANTELLENYQLVADSLRQVQDGISQLEDGISQIEDGLQQIQSNLPLLQLAVELRTAQVNTTQLLLDEALNAGEESLAESLQAQLTEAQAQLAAAQEQLDSVTQTQAELEAQLSDLQAQLTELEETEKTLTDAMNTVNDGMVQLDRSKAAADSEFAAYEAQLQAGYLELDAAQAELDAQTAELQAGLEALEDAQAELDDGWEEYNQGKAEAEAELSDAWAQLTEAQAALFDARTAIDTLEDPVVYALTRDTNTGYISLNSNSDIVSGVSRVFPGFFLLIAALVCITTMTRMVEEERTQIGTLKALGYSNLRIMSKYLLYSASAALIGCTLGILAGCIVFPWILWNAYGILFNITPQVVTVFDWGLSLSVTAAYLAASTFVTWYCCRRTLKEAPAELIRPKAPDPGKKVLLERTPLWNKLSFLNKVMLRNVFRYRQRLAMMLVGIGGCMALLLTGFGIRDTIVDIASIQFEEVDVYDIQVTFSDGLTEQEQQEFVEALGSSAERVGFANLSSVDISFGGQTRSIYLIGGDRSLQNFIDFHTGEEALDMPGTGEALISTGIAELMDISLGDTVTIRNSDMQSLTVTVTGIFDNHVYNYIIISPETIASQWGEEM
ncbi:MAG: FtsX-like permease family protein, partial [Firmicutes bacterium]|nr:FtsX-like permease family protein [Bacillota bacterium]